MNTTVLRVSKVKSYLQLQSFNQHNNRHSKTSNADLKRSHLNRVLIGSGNPEEDVRKVLSEHHVNVRKNAVLAFDGILSLSPIAFEKLSPEDYSKAAVQFLKDEFKGRVRSAHLHLDEKTPHIHFTLVPLMQKKGGPVRLCGRDYMNRVKMRGMQKRYFEFMNHTFPNLKLEPPKHGVKTTHTKVSEFYRLIEDSKQKFLSNITLELNKQLSDRLDGNIRMIRGAFDKTLESASVEALEELNKARELIEDELLKQYERDNTTSRNSFLQAIKETIKDLDEEEVIKQQLQKTITPRPKM